MDRKLIPFFLLATFFLAEQIAGCGSPGEREAREPAQDPGGSLLEADAGPGANAGHNADAGRRADAE